MESDIDSPNVITESTSFKIYGETSMTIYRLINSIHYGTGVCPNGVMLITESESRISDLSRR